MTAYPVVFDLERPAKMSRAHVILRILMLIFVSWIAGSGRPWACLLGHARRCCDPHLAKGRCALFGGGRGSCDQLGRVHHRSTCLHRVCSTDELPGGGRRPVRLEIVRSGSPTVGSASLRIIKAIPSGFVLALIGFIGWIVWLMAAVFILLSERYPENLWNFQRGTYAGRHAFSATSLRWSRPIHRSSVRYRASWSSRGVSWTSEQVSPAWPA